MRRRRRSVNGIFTVVGALGRGTTSRAVLVLMRMAVAMTEAMAVLLVLVPRVLMLLLDTALRDAPLARLPFVLFGCG